MKMSYVAHQAVRTLALLGLLLVPFSLSHAAELVGKPVPVGGPASAPAKPESASGASAPAAPANAASASSVAPPPEPPQAPVPSDQARMSSDLESAQQDIHQAMEDMRRDLHQDFGSGFDPFDMESAMIIPILAISLLFGGPVLLIIVLAILHYRNKARRQKNINANIDKLLAAGKDIPVELLLGEEPAAVRRTVQGEVTVYHGADENMRKGVRNIGLGTGWLIFLTIMFGIKIGAFGFVFIGLGISQVVIWKLSSPSTNTASTQIPDVTRIQD